jgi:hypothetical protein
MCLTISIQADASERDDLSTAAHVASRFGLRVDVEHPSRWSWAESKPAQVFITEDGGCACSMLADDADWSSETWAMRPEVVEPLARTLEALVQHGPRPLVLEALWAGDSPHTEVSLEAGEIGSLVRGEGFGTKVRYVIKRRDNDGVQADVGKLRRRRRR